MLYLAFIFHMHQPYYKNLLTQETDLPWVRLHGTKDYLDMVKILEQYPLIHQTFNLVPSLGEQIEDYANKNIKDKFLELSYRPAAKLTSEEKKFILEKFFMINKEHVVSVHPRYYQLYLQKEGGREFSQQDYLDLQVWFNLAWIDPYFRQNFPELKNIVSKGRFFSEEEKQVVLEKQIEILADILPTYKEFMAKGQIEVTLNPYYHPILPLLYNTKIGKEANCRTSLPHLNFAYPDDARAQIDEAVKFYQERFGIPPQGMWPSEEAVSEHILPLIIQAGIKWIVTDEGLLFKSLKKKKRGTRLLYQPHFIKRKDGNLNIIFRDRNLSDLIGFVYYRLKTEDAVSDLMQHLQNIAGAFKDEDILVTIAMDGENAWEYYPNDGHDFLGLLYQRLSESKIIKTVTIAEYLKTHTANLEIKRLASGSWIFSDFGKWIGNPSKNRAWEYLAKARKELEDSKSQIPDSKLELAYKQMYIAEGSDWFWWYGEDQADFDRLFRMHLRNFYNIIDKPIPEYLNSPI
ncbi:MAG: glycoside hydrolase family 57 protein [Candidatus Omnitrophica bacterium]|nr:glycoside hydrolase family 57 protein [Candidatus Omnitrophota bacterium]MDD5591690.1 glycoside hydrolase family 57 protein [Candidatus Omnitrophota bacterium]